MRYFRRPFDAPIPPWASYTIDLERKRSFQPVDHRDARRHPLTLGTSPQCGPLSAPIKMQTYRFFALSFHPQLHPSTLTRSQLQGTRTSTSPDCWQPPSHIMNVAELCSANLTSRLAQRRPFISSSSISNIAPCTTRWIQEKGRMLKTCSRRVPRLRLAR